jgi:hypothetical protein
MRKYFSLSITLLLLFTLIGINYPSGCFAQTSTGGKSVNPTKQLEKSVNPTNPSPKETGMPQIHLDSAAGGLELEKGECEGDLPSIYFPASKSVNPTQPKSVNPTQPRSNSASLQPNAIKTLQSVAAQLKERPDCKLKVSGNGSSDKASQQLSWDRVNAIIRYLVEKTGISEKRFIFEYGIDGDPNTVDLMFTSEDGPTSVPQPHPQFRTSGH